MPWMGERLRLAREWRNLTGKQLAEKIGVQPSFISELENNHSNPSIETLDKIAKALGIVPAWFIDPQMQAIPMDYQPANDPQVDLPIYIRVIRKASEKGVSPDLLERLIDAVASAQVQAAPRSRRSPGAAGR